LGHGCILSSLLLHLGTRVVAKVLVGARQSCRSLPSRALFLGGCDATRGLVSHFLLCLTSPCKVLPEGFLVIPPLGWYRFCIPCVRIDRTFLICGWAPFALYSRCSSGSFKEFSSQDPMIFCEVLSSPEPFGRGWIRGPKDVGFKWVIDLSPRKAVRSSCDLGPLLSSVCVR